MLLWNSKLNVVGLFSHIWLGVEGHRASVPAGRGAIKEFDFKITQAHQMQPLGIMPTVIQGQLHRCQAPSVW